MESRPGVYLPGNFAAGLTKPKNQNRSSDTMNPTPKNNVFKQLLEAKAAQRAGRKSGVLADNDLARQFRVGEKPQPIIRRGGRNGSGKP